MGLRNTQLKQLCWKCKYSCNKDDCIWVRTLKKRYKGTILDNNGYIISCPKFCRDELLYDNKDRADALGITLAKYNSIKAYIKNNSYKMTVAEYLEYQKQLKEERDVRTSEDRNYYYRLYSARNYVKKHNLPMTAEEYIKMRDRQRELRKQPDYNRNYQKEKYRQKAVQGYVS